MKLLSGIVIIILHLSALNGMEHFATFDTLDNDLRQCIYEENFSKALQLLSKNQFPKTYLTSALEQTQLHKQKYLDKYKKSSENISKQNYPGMFMGISMMVMKDSHQKKIANYDRIIKAIGQSLGTCQ